MAGIKLKVDKYAETKDLLATIVRVDDNGGGHSMISGLIESMPSLGVSINYSAPGEGRGDSVHVASGILNQMGEAAGVDYKLQTINNLKGVTKMWTGSAGDPITIVILMMKPDGLQKAWNFKASCYPSVEGAFMTPPFWSGTDSGQTVPNTVSLRLGTWFHARNLVVDSCSVEPSQELVYLSKTTSRPVYARVTVTLSHSRRLSKQEVQGWYIGG
ncbi:hypothetical protein [Vibrio phage Va2]|nr:hypothetical protein [Vibrio phage Va2]